MFESSTELFKDPETGYSYNEIIDRHALDGVDLSDVILNVNHDVPVIARTRNNSLKLSIDDKGLRVYAELNKSDDARKMYEAVKNGLYASMSFSFTIAPDGQNYDSKTRTRRITKIDRLYDVSIVDIPAYNDTVISARSKMEELAEPERRAFRAAEVRSIHRGIINILEEMNIHDKPELYCTEAENRAKEMQNNANPICAMNPLLRVSIDKTEPMKRRMAELYAEINSLKGSDDIKAAQEARAEIDSLREKVSAVYAEEAETRRKILTGEIDTTPVGEFNINHKKDGKTMENREFYSKLVEKRAAAGSIGMANMIPEEIARTSIREGVNGMYDNISITTIAHSGNLKVPFIADSAITVNAHTENAAITAGNAVPAVVTIKHEERECTLGYSYLGMKLAVNELQDIVNQSLMAGMRRKLDADAVAAVKALTWSAGTNAKAWAASGAPKLAEILALMKMLPERYANGAKLYMNKSTALSVLENSTGKAGASVSNEMFNFSVVDGIDKIFGVPVVIDSNMADGEVLYGLASAVHMNFAGPVELNNWVDHDTMTEKMQVCCAVGAACEPEAFVLGANSIA